MLLHMALFYFLLCCSFILNHDKHEKTYDFTLYQDIAYWAVLYVLMIYQ